MSEKILCVLGGEDVPLNLLQTWCERADIIWAADSGANRVFDAGFLPQVLIGDLDSVRPMVRERVPLVIHDEDQETTDTQKLLAYAAREGASAITLTGLEGDLPDHFLGTLLSLAEATVTVEAAFRRGRAWFLRAGDLLRISSPAERRLSLLPLDGSLRAELTGAKWPFSHFQDKNPPSRSVSNETLGDPIEIHVESSVMVFLEVPPEEMPWWTVE